MKKMSLTLGMSLLILSQGALATDLLDIIVLAHRNDPTFKQAQSSYAGNKETLSQARANLFPVLETNASGSFYNNTTNQATGQSASTVNSRQRSYTVRLTQPVFDLRSWLDIKRSHQVVKQAEADVKVAEQDLFVRAANAYFDVLEANDTLRFTTAEKKANARQLDQARQRYKVGLDAVTSVYDAKAAFDAVAAREINSRNEVQNKFESLREITGVLHGSLVPLRSNVPLMKPDPADVSTWVTFARKRNYELMSKRFQTEAARYAVKVQRAEYVPKVNVVASYTDNRGRNFGTSTFDQKVKDIAVAVESPTLQGGRLLSQSRQQQATYETALAELDATEKGVVSKVRQSYNSVLSGISAVRADRQAVISAQSSLESTEAAFKVGTRTIVDVLDKQKDLFDNQRRLASDQYAYIRSVLNLKQAAGILSIADLEEINTMLKGPTAHTTFERFRKTRVSDQVVAANKDSNPTNAKAQYASKDTKPSSTTASAEQATSKAASDTKVAANAKTDSKTDSKTAAVSKANDTKTAATTKASTSVADNKTSQQQKGVIQSINKSLGLQAKAESKKPEPALAPNHPQIIAKPTFKQLPADTTLSLVAATTHDAVIADNHQHPAKSFNISNKPKTQSASANIAKHQEVKQQMFLQMVAPSSDTEASTLAKKIAQLTQQSVDVVKQTANNQTVYKLRIGPFVDSEKVYKIHDQLEKAGIGEPAVVLK